jgi:hypothetical protein
MVAKAEIRLPSGLILSYEGEAGSAWGGKSEPVAELFARLLACMETEDWAAVVSAAKVLHGPPRPRPAAAPVEPKAAATPSRKAVQPRPDPQAAVAQPGLDLVPA